MLRSFVDATHSICSGVVSTVVYNFRCICPNQPIQTQYCSNSILQKFPFLHLQLQQHLIYHDTRNDARIILCVSYYLKKIHFSVQQNWRCCQLKSRLVQICMLLVMSQGGAAAEGKLQQKLLFRILASLAPRPKASGKNTFSEFQTQSPRWQQR